MQSLETLVSPFAIQRRCRFVPKQRIRAPINSQLFRQMLRQKRRLVVPSPQQAVQVQRDRHGNHTLAQHVARSAGHPARCRSCDVLPVAVFQRQHQSPPLVTIDQRRAPLHPWARDLKAFITQFGAAGLSRQGYAAQVTAQPRNKRCLLPAGGAQAKIGLDQPPAGQAARRVNQLNEGLHPRRPETICLHMDTPRLTDHAALALHRARASRDPALFLHEAALDEAQDRLGMVNKDFSDPAIITPFPGLWRQSFPAAKVIPDTEVLDLDEASHDLVIHALGLHWADDPVGQLIQCRRALRPDGLLVVLTFGGQTLSELRAALGQAEIEVTGGLSPRVAPMGELRDLGALLQRAGLALPVADTAPLTVTYRDLFHLMSDLRAMGETNALQNRLRKPTRRAVFLRAAQLYAETFGKDGRIPATFEIVTLTGWAPDASQPQPLRPGSAAHRLADALGTQEKPLKD